MKEIPQNLLTVFRQWKYSLLAIVIALFFYSFNALLLNFRTVFAAFGTHGLAALKYDYFLISGYKDTLAFHSFVTLVIISILFGILFSLILYKTIRFSKRNHPGLWGNIGIFLGVIAPGCAACGIGVFSLFGVSASLVTFLPFRGLELSVLAIIALVYAILRFAQDLNTCKL